ncbi:hypothetical protein CEUSTIGMA_g12961.t1 [Chlamydomonas eustigma]|uniref:Uncharacterized protein n=1 Tax=Chlamydomonas eustigma TaxID=1157962 RepID=A0A250XR77_9CHLO|nr:hypothetical protein CEUSTIGMA_g12961.t1 [Chlamydomonas eustigma]|eukprot:GAX85546.1 hypothetical protein CEUSTIGMA_g12961.t1 [Chlamydomonas eustigma]
MASLFLKQAEINAAEPKRSYILDIFCRYLRAFVTSFFTDTVLQSQGTFSFVWPVSNSTVLFKMSAAKQDSSLSAMSEIMSTAQAVGGPECYHQNCQQQNLSSFAYDDQLLLKDSYLWHQHKDSTDLLKGGDLSHGIHPECTRDQDHQPLWDQLYFQLEEAKHLLDRREKLDACRAGNKQDVNALQAHLKSLLCTLSDSIKRIQPCSSSNQLLTSTPDLVGDGTSGTDAGLIESSDGISTPLKFISHPNTQPSSSSPLLSMPLPVSQYLVSSGCSRDTDAFLLKHLSHPSQCPSSRESHKSQLGLCPLVHLTELLSLSQQASLGSVDSQRSASSSAQHAVLSTAASSVEDGEMTHKHADSSNLLELSVLITSLSLPFILYLCSQISEFLLRQQGSKAVSASRTLRPSEQEANRTSSVNPAIAGMSNTDEGCGQQQDWLHSSQARVLGHCLNFGGAYSSEASAPQQPPPAVVTTSVVNKEEGSLIRRLVAQFSTCNTTKPAAITRLLCKPAREPTATAGACLVPGAATVVAPASDLEDDDDTTHYVHLNNNSNPRPVRCNAELQTITMIAGGDDDVLHQNRDNDQAASRVMTIKASLHQGYEGPPSKSERSTHHVSEMTASGTAALMMSPVLQFHGTLTSFSPAAGTLTSFSPAAGTLTSFSPAAPPVAEMPLISTISSSVRAAWSITSRSSDAAAPSFSTQHQLHQQHGEQDHCPVVMGNSIGSSSTSSETGCQQQVLLPACDQYPSAVEDVVGATNNTNQQQVEPYLLATSSSLVSKLRAAVVTSSTLCEAAKTQVKLVGNTFFAQPYAPRQNLSPDYSSARSLKVLQTAAGYSTADCQGQACPDDSEIVLIQQKDVTNRRLLPTLPLADKTIFQELHHYSATDGEDASGADGEDASGADGEDASGADGEDASGADGEDASGADGEDASGADGEDASGADGEDASGADGEDASGADGEDASGSLALALQDSFGNGHSALPHLYSHTSTADDYCYGGSSLRSSLGIRETLRELDSKHHEEQLRSLKQMSSDHGSTLEALVRSYKSQLSHLAAQLCAEQQYSRDLRIQLQELHGDIRMGDAMIATLCMTASNSSAHDGVVLHELQHV